MSLAKATFSGKVYREPQKRSTSNNVPITSFQFDIGEEGNEDLIKVSAIGNMADTVEKNVAKNDYLVVEGNLIMSTAKSESGEERKFIELRMLSFEKIVGSSSSVKSENEEIVKFTPNNAGDLIGEDEIPF